MMRIVPKIDWEKANFGQDKLKKVLAKQDVDALVQFLNRHGGANAMDEYGCTALITLQDAEIPCEMKQKFAGRLIEMGGDVNWVSWNSWTPLRKAVKNGDYAMAEYLLNCPGIDLQSISYSDMKDRMAALFVRAGYEVFNSPSYEDPFPAQPPIEYWLRYHQGWYSKWTREFVYESFRETLETVRQLYPDRLPEVPPFYLDTVEYDFLFHDFWMYRWDDPPTGEGLQSFLDKLDRGLESCDEGGRNLLSCCALLSRRISPDYFYHPNRHPQRRKLAPRPKAWAEILLEIGISLTQPDFQGKTPVDHLKWVGMADLIPEVG